MFDLAKKDTENSSKSVKFWDEVEKKNIIPDRTSQSLRTAWRKYSKYGEEQFIKEALKDPKIRFSHQFETVPYLSSSKLNLPPPESVRAEANEQNDKSVDMTVLSQEESDEPEEAGEAAEDAEDAEDEDLEFVLAIDDLQSAFAFNATDCQSYSLKVQKRKTCSGNLHAMYDNRDDKIRCEERKKVSEGFEADENFQAAKKSNPTSPKRVDGLQSNSTEIYNQSDLFSFLTKDLHLTLNRDMKSNKLTVKSKLMLKEQNQFFEKLSKELRDLAKEYNKDIDQLHLLFMEVSCDLGELKALLKGEKASRFTMLEDLALQNDPDSIELKYINNKYLDHQVQKRRKFLEMGP